MAKMILTLGLPASGKTTWAKEYVRDNPNTVIVCRDDIRAELFSPKKASYIGDRKLWIDFTQDQIKTIENQGKVTINSTVIKRSDVTISVQPHLFRWRDYRFTRAKEQRVTEVQDQKIADAVHQGKDIIIADTNLNPKTQSKLREKAKAMGYEVEVKDFTSVPVVQCLRWDEQRDNSVGRGVILDMFEKYICKPAPTVYPHIPNAVVFDMDGTICHMNGKRKPFEWDKVMVDDPDPQVLEVLDMYKSAGYTIIIFTARDGVCRELCAAWLAKHNVPYDYLFTRKENDQRKDYTAKQEMYEEHILGNFNVRCVYDDREQVVLDVWRRNGFKCMQVGNGCF